MTTTLLIQTETTPLRISLPAIAPMTTRQYHAIALEAGRVGFLDIISDEIVKLT
ncbi:hypothetical protein [Coleofasciculus sp.]|uniref:hypothetical protein n=1 Tax=Coleofasciculus sp. TaxID=3100458 RepID=UPI003A22984B